MAEGTSVEASSAGRKDESCKGEGRERDADVGATMVWR
jgi:hypothetical protein